MKQCKKILCVFLVGIFILTSVFVYPTKINAINQENEHILEGNLFESYSRTWGGELFNIGINDKAFNLPVNTKKMVIEFSAKVDEFSSSEPLGAKIEFKDKRLMFKVANSETVNYCDTNGTWAKTKNFSIGTEFNVYRIECDGEAGTAVLYINGTKINDSVINLQKKSSSEEILQIWSGNNKAKLSWIKVYEEGKCTVNDTWGEVTPQKVKQQVYSCPSNNSIVEFRAKVNQFANGEVLGAKIELGNQRLMLQIFPNKLAYCNANKTWGENIDYKIENLWHVYRLENDFENKKSILYVDGNEMATIDLQQGNYGKEFRIWSTAGEAVLDYVRVYEKIDHEGIPMWGADDQVQITAFNDVDFAKLKISWPKASQANSYLVKVKDTLNEHIIQELQTSATEVVVENLQKGIGYNVEVQAKNDFGISKEKLHAYQDTQYDFSNGSQLSVKNLMVAGNGYKSYRIPSLVATSKGTLLAMAEARSSASDWAPMDAVIMRSEDGGETWSERKIMAAGEEDGFACNNPILIPAIDNQGRSIVILIYCKDYGVDIHGQGGVFVRKSLDDGKTWSEPYEITENCMPEYRNVVATGPGHGIQLRYNQEHQGRLVVSVWMTPKKYGKPVTSHGPAEVATLYSDDMGETWQMGELIPLGDVVNPNESTVVELNDGRVMINMRNTTGNQKRAVSISPDGISNWSEPYFDDALNCPICFGSLVRYDDNTILFVNPDTKSGRTKGTVKISYDNGKTWPVKRMLNLGSSGYADIAVSEVNGEKQISVLLETVVLDTNGNNSLTLYRFPLSWITDGMDEQLIDLTVDREKIDLQKDVYNYKVNVGLNQKEVVLTAKAFDKNSTITIDGKEFTGNEFKVRLNGINTVINIKIGQTNYTLHVEKEIPASSEDCVLYYSMDSINNGIVLDETQYHNNGTARGSITIGADAKFGKSLTLNDGEIISSNSKGLAFGTSDFTVNAWIKPQNTGKQQFIFWYGSLGVGSKAWWLRREDNGSLQLLLGDGKGHEDSIKTPENTVPENQWANITVLRQEKEIKLLVNGEVKASKVMNMAYDVNGENLFGIAHDKTGGSRKFIGQIDEVRAYNYALSQPQIEGLVRNEIPVSAAKDILSFSINDYNAEISGNKISLTLPEDTDLTNLKPEIIVAPNAQVSPSSNVGTDFTNPVKYTVTAQDGTTKVYEVSVVLGDVVEDQKVIYKQPKPIKVSTNIAGTNKVKANFLGDSITYGQDPANSQKQVKQYHAYLADMINIDNANYGIRGSTISVLDRGGDRQPFTMRYKNMRDDADIIFVFGGTNDYGVPENAPFGKWNDRTDTSYLGGLRVLMEGLIEKYPNKQIVFMTPIKRESKGANRVGKVLYEYGNAIKDMANEYGIPVIDAYNDKEMNLLLDKEMYISDGLHPSAKGHEKMANWIYQQLIDKKVITIDNPVEKIELDCSEKELIVGESYQLQATIKPDNASNKEIIWTSSNDQIVTVKDGMITAINEGEAEIKAVSKDGKISASCIVRVKKVVIDSDKVALKIALELANAITDEDLANVVPVVVNEFKQARNQANEVYNDATASQDEVNAAFDRVASIMQKLEFFKGDKTALKAFIDKVSGLEAAKYTEATWPAFNDTLTAATDVYNDENAMQEEVNNAYNELVTAFLNLRLIPDKSLLEDLINKANGLESANYTKATFDGLTKALNEAKVVFDNPSASQKEVDNAKDVLAKAIADLQTVKAPVNNGDTTVSVKTGDESLVGMFAGIALLGIVGAKVLRKKEND